TVAGGDVVAVLPSSPPSGQSTASTAAAKPTAATIAATTIHIRPRLRAGDPSTSRSGAGRCSCVSTIAVPFPAATPQRPPSRPSRLGRRDPSHQCRSPRGADLRPWSPPARRAHARRVTDRPFSDIIVPLDGSPVAERALGPALALVRRTGAPVRVM